MWIQGKNIKTWLCAFSLQLVYDVYQRDQAILQVFGDQAKECMEKTRETTIT